MRFIVTGGSGFIGTNVIDKLLELGETVLNIDIVKPMNNNHSKYYHNCDIRNLDDFKRSVFDFNPDYIIHLAARTDLDGENIDDYNANTLGVKNLCLICEDLKSLKKVLFASSMLVCHPGYIPKDIYDFSPKTIYGESKVKGEEIVRSFCDHLPDFVIARPTSIWGPWFRTPYKDFFDMVLSKKFIDGGNKFATKTYGYIGNVSNQIISLVMSTDDNENKVIYLGDNKPIEIRKWANDIAIEAKIRKPLRVPFFIFRCLAILGDLIGKIGIHFPMTSFRLKNMTTNNILDCRIAENANSFKKYSYSDALAETIYWLQLRKR